MRVSGSDVEHLAVVGSVRGIVPLAVAARCGPGTALLACGEPGSPRLLQFAAPGGSLGQAVAVYADGAYVLEDGTDPSKWLRVEVARAWLPDSSAQARLFLADRYNEVGPDDVDAADAAAGKVETFTLELANVSPDLVRDVRAWLAPSATGLEISTDGTTWYAPTSEVDAHVLAWASIARAASATVYVRRTTAAAVSPAPAILNLVELAWSGL